MTLSKSEAIRKYRFRPQIQQDFNLSENIDLLIMSAERREGEHAYDEIHSWVMCALHKMLAVLEGEVNIILDLIPSQPLCISTKNILKATGLTKATISYHLNRLKKKKLVKVWILGRKKFYQIEASGI